MESIVSKQAPKPIGPYSQAIRAGEWLYCSGQLPIDQETGKIETQDTQEQTRQVLENLRAVLRAAGQDLSQVVKTTVYMIDLKEFQDMNKMYGEYFNEPYPARAAVQVAALPAGARVEIDAVAYLGKD